MVRSFAGLELVQVPFEHLDFGKTGALDLFYNADIAIVDLSVQVRCCLVPAVPTRTSLQCARMHCAVL